MSDLVLVLTLSLAVLLLVALVRVFRPKKVFVLQYQRGVLFRSGRLERVLDPGTYWTTLNSGITLIDTRLQVLDVPGQEILTADGISLKISLAGTYQIVNPALFITASTSAGTVLYVSAQQALRSAVAEQTFDTILTTRPALDARIADLLAPEAGALGLRIATTRIRDLMLPAEIKRAFAQAITAQKEGLAALERARSETASLRSLANAARLMQDQPALLQLRAIQAAEASRGNTLVLGIPGNPVIVPTDRTS